MYRHKLNIPMITNNRGKQERHEADFRMKLVRFLGPTVTTEQSEIIREFI